MSEVIQILAQENNPDGIKIIQIHGWSGKAFLIPRANLKEIKGRQDINQPGIYFLFGEGEGMGNLKIYIGESESFYNRLNEHDSGKDFWNNAMVFTGGLDRADVKYLENKCYSMAKQSGRHEILNISNTKENQLDEFKKVSVDKFFEKIQYLLKLFGYTVFQEKPKESQSEDIYYLKSEKCDAKGALLSSGEFAVFGGSFVRIKETESFKETSGSFLRKRLIEEGILRKHDKDSFIFVRDHVFTSPSAASDVVTGRSSNGWTSWRDSTGKTLDELKRK